METRSSNSPNSSRKPRNGLDLRPDDGGRYTTKMRNAAATLDPRSRTSRHWKDSAGHGLDSAREALSFTTSKGSPLALIGICDWHCPIESWNGPTKMNADLSIIAKSHTSGSAASWSLPLGTDTAHCYCTGLA
ncbi:hypothetical protein LSAT2_032086 [Lamellibrachia satsuma]|nr:hypothetical protein LSAT2_032086 [Lamellibrachia satsuma]